MLLATDRDYDVVHVPPFVRSRSVRPDAIYKMAIKTIKPKPDCVLAYNHATLGEKIFDICRTQREPMISPDRVGDDFTRVAAALQAERRSWYFYVPLLTKSAGSKNLAMLAGEPPQ